jgi:hypothetical protein
MQDTGSITNLVKNLQQQQQQQQHSLLSQASWGSQEFSIQKISYRFAKWGPQSIRISKDAG